MTAYEKYLEQRGILEGVRSILGVSGIAFTVSIPGTVNPAAKEEFERIVNNTDVQRKLLSVIGKEATDKSERYRSAAKSELAEVMREAKP